jgi:hypothetical protein
LTCLRERQFRRIIAGLHETAHVARRGHAVAGLHARPVQVQGLDYGFDGGPGRDVLTLEEAQNAEALLLGRVTYEAMQAMRRLSSTIGRPAIRVPPPPQVRPRVREMGAFARCGQTLSGPGWSYRSTADGGPMSSQNTTLVRRILGATQSIEPVEAAEP